jgi:hypothetical protein
MMVLFRFQTQLAIQYCGRNMKGMLTVSNKAALDCLSLNKNVSPGLVGIESKYFTGTCILNLKHGNDSFDYFQSTKLGLSAPLF